MTNSLLHRVEQVRRIAQRVVWCHAVGWFVATWVLGFLAINLFDYFVRPIDPLARWLMTGVFLACAGLGIWRWLRNAWLFQPTLLETAQRIEQRYPQLHERLSGSVEFLEQTETDPAAGSLALRRRVIAATEDAIAQIDLPQVVNAKPQLQAICIASTLLALVGIWSLINPHTLAIAAGRIAMPWSNYTWPRRTHLEFVDPPERIARGQTWEATVRDSANQPLENVTLAIRYENGETVRHAMKFLGGQMVHRLENITRPFEYRVYGGDDNTNPWRTLDVMDPLRLVEIKANVHPPTYAGPAWEATGNVFTMLAGSTIQIAGRVDRPLAAAFIQRDKSEEQLPLELAADGLSFGSIKQVNKAWQPRESGVYVLSLQDVHGIASPTAFRWEVRVSPDNSPTLTLDSPTDAMQVTPDALLPVEGVAKDDLALQRIALKYLRPNATDEPPAEIVLWQSERNPLLGAKALASTGGEAKTFAAAWDLQQLTTLKPGDVLSWYVEATDFRPQSGQTSLAKLAIISPTEMQERLAQRQLSALAQLAEALKLQRETRGKIGSLEVQWSELSKWRPRDRDTLQSAELHQRQTQTLTGLSPTGAATILKTILREIEINRLELPDMHAKCSELLATLNQLDREHYPTIGQHFSELLRETKNAGDVAVASRKELASLGKEQETVIQLLEGLLENLSEWDNFQRLRRDLIQLRKAQQEVTANTQQLQTNILTEGKATPQQTADAKQLSRQQSDLARQFEKWQLRLAQYAERTDAANDAIRTAQATLAAVNQAAIAAKMRSASQSLGESKLGTGLERQQEIDAALAKLLDELAGRKQEESAEQLQQLRDTMRRVDDLLNQQKKLADELAHQAEQKKPELQRLEERQNEVANKTDALTKQIERAQPNSPAGQATKSASESMKQASSAAKQNDAKTAAEQAREAEKKLAAAKQAVQQEIANREADLLREQLVKLEQHIQGLLIRQEALEKESQRLRTARMQQGNLTATQIATCQELQNEQEALASETNEQGRSPQMPPAFAWQLEQTSREMQQASQQLGKQQPSEAILAQQSAITRLRLILLALQQDAANPPPNEKPPGEQPPAPPMPPTDGNPPDIHDLAEVKLLRAMQMEINRRTLEIEAQRTPTGTLPPELSERLGTLAEEQGKLVDLTLKMVRKLSQPPPTPKPELPTISDEDLLKKLDEALLPREPLPIKKPEK